ncbi:hypothetical protein PU560_14320 [Georgenia sp. 10Sc9-8]|uniref:HTH tetR-type domain-containing protein n=1 Tax=Georgenia halotolerans TaxID=3028317 RepID=A0ABT5U053_9MICO|nr:hypothetical protein [Georgenia halotolerans]
MTGPGHRRPQDAVHHDTGSDPGPQSRRLTKGERRRASLVAAAAELILAEGPQSVTHRAVAARAGSSLSATTYYFADLPDLLGAAGELLMGRWADRAEAVAERAEHAAGAAEVMDPVALLLEAVLPRPEQVRGHYQQLVGAGVSPAVTRAYRSGRHRLDAAVGRLLRAGGSACPPELAVAVVDGAVVTALSEGTDVTAAATSLLRRVL